MKKQQKLYTVFAYEFAVFLVLAAGIVLLTHDNPFLQLGRFSLLLATVAVGGVLAALIFFWDRKGSVPKQNGLLLLAVFLIYFAAQLWVAHQFQVLPRGDWDFTWIFQEAENRVLRGEMPTAYFGKFPNNIPYYWLLCGFFSLLHLFGVNQFMLPLLLLNSLCISVSLWFVYDMARRLLGTKWAWMILLLGMASPALLLYVPIAYTDTLTMPFVCGAAWLWILAREAYQAGRMQKTMCYAGLAGVTAALGASLKVTVAILWIAFALDVLLFWSDRARWKSFLVGSVAFVLVLQGTTALARSAMPKYDVEKIPYTHWIMMGLHEDGNYWDADYELTLSYPTYEERVAFHKQEIPRRIQEMGPIGFLDHIREKLSFMLSDGTYYAPCKLNRGPVKPSVWHEFVVQGGKYAGFLYYFADGMQLCLLLGCALGSWRAAKNGDHRLTVFRVALFGMVLFLLIWENRSRYLVHYLPLFLLCAGAGLIPVQKEKAS